MSERENENFPGAIGQRAGCEIPRRTIHVELYHVAAGRRCMCSDNVETDSV